MTINTIKDITMLCVKVSPTSILLQTKKSENGQALAVRFDSYNDLLLFSVCLLKALEYIEIQGVPEVAIHPTVVWEFGEYVN